jgi:hypothetical protein
VFLTFLESATIREERVPNGRGEIVFLVGEIDERAGDDEQLQVVKVLVYKKVGSAVVTSAATAAI